MNCRNKFKLTAIAMMVGSSMSANAALYQVIEVSPEVNGDVVDYQTAYGVAIQQGDVEVSGSAAALGCFDSAAGCTEEQFKLAVETRTTPLSSGQAVDGISYREELPFAMDARFAYVDDEDDFESYCYYHLGYNTCETWASVNYAPWRQEYYYKDFTSNALAFVEGDSAAYVNEYNNVINSLTEDGQAVGNQSIIDPDDSSSLETRNKIVAPVVPAVVETDSGVVESHAWKTDGTFTVGSISRSATNTNGTHHTSKAAIWDQTGTESEISWETDDFDEDERLAQGSMRDFIVDGTTVYGVGYNTFDSDRNQLNAAVFVGSLQSETSIADGVTWSSKVVAGARQREDGDNIHSNSRLTGVNENFIGIGEAKRSISTSGAYPNRLFIVSDVRADSLSATYLNSGIFFSGAGGKMGAINAYNEIVGQLDADSTREDDGKPRRKRGFIYPYNADSSVSERLSLFQNKAWFLDDLTNGDSDDDISEGNNEFRIIDATDINDAGVISGTAFKCAGGYNSTAHNASCDDTETVVAVKLLPLGGKTQDDIVTRSVESESATREGAGLGWLALTMLGLFGFRRK
ncbi:DUF3466 family protein [Vibrio alginolyticus]|uniref:DUF3466 family protein n=1 Tax=Vibrio sp. B1FLJ16 TaxID=2751178 RepID=UPI0015F5E55D|nr:DUF3466 family protein [Vibrio sp. B1FLJ16]CAD7805667.1 hypothetical protein ACOMICROBIO_FLGHMIGD_01414 [Vibrio sp. B1FLJ16]CAE6900306.1 hypothetical protein ACOMICROBIO_FLGHMIGD_01414 [Vibrio sp. B1FLJ16]